MAQRERDGQPPRKRQKVEQAGALDTQLAERQVWLVKLPVRLAKTIHALPDGVDLGTVTMVPPKPMVILVSGKRLSGKATVGILVERELAEASRTCLRMSFAEVCKRAYAIEVGLDPEVFASTRPDDQHIRNSHSEGLLQFFHKVEASEPLKFCRMISERVQELHKANPIDVVVVTNCRHLHELEYFEKAIGGTNPTFRGLCKVRIDVSDEARARHGWAYSDADADPTEYELDMYNNWTARVPNEASIDDLAAVVREMVVPYTNRDAIPGFCVDVNDDTATKGPYGEVPRGYTMALQSSYPATYIFSEAEKEGSKMAVQGHMTSRFDLKPELNDAYGTYSHKRTEEANRVTRTSMSTDMKVDSIFARPGAHRAATQVEKRLERMGGRVDKHVAADKEVVRNQLFALFETQPRWSRADLIERTKQPERALLIILKEICEFHDKGEFKGLYELKSDYRMATPDMGLAS